MSVWSFHASFSNSDALFAVLQVVPYVGLFLMLPQKTLPLAENPTIDIALVRLKRIVNDVCVVLCFERMVLSPYTLKNI